MATTATYLPNTVLPPTVPLYTFVQLAADDEAADYQTALRTAFPDAGPIQCFDDGETDGNILVVIPGEDTLSVPPLSSIGYNRGQWAMHTAAKLSGLYTAYDAS